MDLTPPPDEITIKIGAEERTIFMSFGLLKKVVGVAGVSSDTGEMFADPDAQASFIWLLLEPKKWKASEPAPDDFYEIHPKDAERLCVWGVTHALHFLMRGVARAIDVSKMAQPMAETLTSLVDGSVNSTSRPRAPGPLESQPAS